VKSQDSSVGIVTRLQAGQLESDRAGNFSLHYCVQTGSGACPTSHPVGAGGFFSLGVEQPVCEAGHLTSF